MRPAKLSVLIAFLLGVSASNPLLAACPATVSGDLIFSTDWYDYYTNDLAFQITGGGAMEMSVPLNCEWLGASWNAQPPLTGYQFAPFQWAGYNWLTVGVYDTGSRNCSSYEYDPYTMTIYCIIDYPIWAVAAMEGFSIDLSTLQISAYVTGSALVVDYAWTWIY